jgi:hypothetical protein
MPPKRLVHVHAKELSAGKCKPGNYMPGHGDAAMIVHDQLLRLLLMQFSTTTL